jgi:hypothetical protein
LVYETGVQIGLISEKNERRKISHYFPFNNIKYNYINGALKLKEGSAAETLALSVCKSASSATVKGLELVCFGFLALLAPTCCYSYRKI